LDDQKDIIMYRRNLEKFKY